MAMGRKRRPPGPNQRERAEGEMLAIMRDETLGERAQTARENVAALMGRAFAGLVGIVREDEVGDGREEIKGRLMVSTDGRPIGFVPQPDDRCGCACGCYADIYADHRLIGLDTGGRCWACETAKREGRAPHGPRTHEFVDRDDSLALCGACGGGEGSLPTECPGARMTEAQEADVYAGKKDFRNGRWVHLSVPPAPGAPS